MQHKKPAATPYVEQRCIVWYLTLTGKKSVSLTLPTPSHSAVSPPPLRKAPQATRKPRLTKTPPPKTSTLATLLLPTPHR